jgi:hypothetical protein
MDDSKVTLHQHGGATFQGKDGVRLFQAIALKGGLKLYAATGMKPNRAWTPTAMLKLAESFTGKRYKRGQHQQAADDMTIWIDAMRAAMPIENNRD